MQDALKTPPAARKSLLERRLAELGTRLEGIEAELDSPHDPDWEEQATEREGDEVLEASGRAGQQEIAMIRAALGRVAEGSYGTCVRCGDPIGDARLDLLPWTPVCRRCAT